MTLRSALVSLQPRQSAALKPSNYSLVGYIVYGNNWQRFMMKQHDKGKSRLPLSTPVFHVLLSLTERELHGYGIIQDIERRTDGDVTLSTSTLYGAIKRMMRDDLVERSDKQPDPAVDDERRRYYRITEFGRDVARHEARRIERLAKVVRNSRLLTRAP